MEKAKIIVICFFLSCLWSKGLFIFIKKMPEVWLCDYDEIPGPEHHPQNRPCQSCGMKIILCIIMWAAGSILIFKKYPPLTISISDLLLMTIFGLLFMISALDGKYMIIPDQLVLGMIVCGIGLIFSDHYLEGVSFQASCLYRIGGGIVCSGFYLFLSLVSTLITKKQGIGMGDIKLLFAVGMCCGGSGVLFIICFISISSCLSFSVQVLLKRLDFGSYQAMAPYIAGACFTYLLVI